MPNGTYPIPTGLPIRNGRAPQLRRSRPGVGLQLRSWWRRDRLDERLAQGTDPRMSAELMLRARQLGSGAERTRLAEAVEGVLREAREPAGMTPGGDDACCVAVASRRALVSCTRSPVACATISRSTSAARR